MMLVFFFPKAFGLTCSAWKTLFYFGFSAAVVA
jgi:hypothetical protein